MSAMNTEVQISPKDLGSVPRPVATLVCELVNKHGVRYRMQNNGGHIYLYNGDTQSRPYKISASRPAETTLDFLEKWIKKNVPDYGKAPEPKTVTPNDVAKLAAVVNTTAHQEKADVTSSIEGGWTDPDKWGFITNGEIWSCTYEGCDYQRDDNKGLHLHAYSHTGRSSDLSRQAAQSRNLNQTQKETLIEAAVTTIAEQFGLVVVPKERTKVNVEKLVAENESLKKQVEDLKARVSLINEALRA